MASDKPSERSAEIRKRVVAAREIQKQRFEGCPGLFANAQMSSRMVREYCRIDEAGQMILKQAMDRLGLSARAYDRILKVARTIANLTAARTSRLATSARPSTSGIWTGTIGGGGDCIAKNAEMCGNFVHLPFKTIPMPLHRKKHYDQRRWLMKQPFEEQEKSQRRLDSIFYAILAVAVVVAMSFSLFKDHSIGMAVFFFLFLIWWTYFAFKSDLHQLAKKKGWDIVEKMTYDPKAEEPCEEAALREERLKHPMDTETLILIENETNLEELEIILFDYVEVTCKTLCDDLPLLWKVGEYRYAITFPCGISRKPLNELMDNLICFLDTATVYGWCRPKLFKNKGYGWLFLRNGSEDMLVAYSDDGTLWNIDAADAILRNPHPSSGFREYPTIDWNTAEKLGLYF